jgi:hypothetical protein
MFKGRRDHTAFDVKKTGGAIRRFSSHIDKIVD